MLFARGARPTLCGVPTVDDKALRILRAKGELTAGELGAVLWPGKPKRALARPAGKVLSRLSGRGLAEIADPKRPARWRAVPDDRAPAAHAPSTKTKRRVTAYVSPLLPRRGRPLAWAYGLADIADALGLSVAGVRAAIQRERLDPADLRSLIAYASQRRKDSRGSR